MAKVSKEVNSVDLADVNLARELSATFDINAERVWWGKARAKVESGSISVRGLKETIKLVEQTGEAPTIRSTWSQYFMDAFSVEDLEGGKAQPLKAILNVTIQGTRKTGGREGFAEILKGVKSFKALQKKVEALPKKESAKSGKSEETSAEDVEAYLREVMISADAVVVLALGLLQELEGDSAVIHDVANARKLKRTLDTFMSANPHASIRSKVSA